MAHCLFLVCFQFAIGEKFGKTSLTAKRPGVGKKYYELDLSQTTCKTKITVKIFWLDVTWTPPLAPGLTVYITKRRPFAKHHTYLIGFQMASMSNFFPGSHS